MSFRDLDLLSNKKALEEDFAVVVDGRMIVLAFDFPYNLLQ